MRRKEGAGVSRMLEEQKRRREAMYKRSMSKSRACIIEWEIKYGSTGKSSKKILAQVISQMVCTTHDS